MSTRYVTDEAHDPRERFGLYRLCDCLTCEGRGQVSDMRERLEMLTRVPVTVKTRCPECRGEGKVRQEVASCATPEAVGVALVTLGREGEWTGCAFGVLDREGEKGKKWLVLPWLPSPRNASDAGKLLRSRRTG